MTEFDVQLSAENKTGTAASAVEENTAQTLKKKPFVEPAISVPIDVLEATTFFFQIPVDSGSL